MFYVGCKCSVEELLISTNAHTVGNMLGHPERQDARNFVDHRWRNARRNIARGLRMNTEAPSYTPSDKLSNRALRNFLSATAMLGHLCALYDRGVFEAGRLMSNLLFQLAVKRRQTNTPLLEQAGIPDTFRIIVDEKTLGSNLPAAATMSPLVGPKFGLRSDAGRMVPAAYWLPAVLNPGPAPAFSALTVDAWLDDPVIPTTQKILSRRDLINSVRDQDGGAHSDPDAKLQKLIAYVELVNAFPASKAAHVQTPEGITFAWELLPPVTMALLRQISHELLSSIYSQTDVRESIYLPTLVCIFEGTNLKGACVPEGYSRIGTVHGKQPAVIQRKAEQS